MDAVGEQKALPDDSVAGSNASQKNNNPLRGVLPTAGRWGLGWWAFFWFEFFCAAMLAMANDAWRSLFLGALTGATSFNFVLVMTALNLVMILVVHLFPSPKRARGWAGWELNILRFSAEAGVALTMFGIVATVAIMAAPSLNFCIGMRAAWLFVFIPALATLTNIQLHFWHEEALENGGLDDRKVREWSQRLAEYALRLAIVALAIVALLLPPVFFSPLAESHQNVMKTLEEHLLGKQTPEERDAARKQGVSQAE